MKEERIYFSSCNSSWMVPQPEMSSGIMEAHRLTASHPEVRFGFDNYMSNLAIAAARNNQFWKARESGADWLWFLDTDHRFPQGTFQRLYETAVKLRDADPNFITVAALYYGRTYNHPPMGLDRTAYGDAFKAAWADPNTTYKDWHKIINDLGQEVLQTTTAPTGCMIINMRNANKLQDMLYAQRQALYEQIYTWANVKTLHNLDKIENVEDREGAFIDLCANLLNTFGAYQAHLPALFVGQYTEKGELVTTEDYYFTYNATMHGFKSYIDTKCEIQHIIREFWYPAHRIDEPTPRPEKNQKMEVAGKNTFGIVTKKPDGGDGLNVGCTFET